MVYVIFKDDDEGLVHYGIKRKSGRYPWGSGEDPYQSLSKFTKEVVRLENEGYSQAEIAEMYGLKNSSDLRDFKSIAKGELKNIQRYRVERLKEKQWSNQAIAEELGLSGESQVRQILKPSYLRAQKQYEATVDSLKAQVDAKRYLEVGKGTEIAMGVSETVKNRAIRDLHTQGYERHILKVPQVGTGEMTTNIVLTPPGVEWNEVRQHIGDIQSFSGSVEENLKTNNPIGWQKPKPISPDRVKVIYDEDGGSKADGVIFLRPGVKDLSMGENHYAQVRIQVGDKHYLKGMAVYKDDLPDGVDIAFNTNKSRSKGKLDVMKPMKTNPDGTVDYDNPFGATIKRQIFDNKGKVSSVVNIVNDESDWDSWSKNLSSQFLSKQSLPLAKTQLELSISEKQSDLDDILRLTNPTVRKDLLLRFADSADASAEHLKAAQMPRQKTHVILPVNSLKDTEVYAPNFKDGERIVLIRYPHGGTFEIPELTVNNRNPEGISLVGKTNKTALGINHKVAERLSGADFDGDTVVAIPNNTNRIKTKSPLKALEGFDPKRIYGPPEDLDISNPPFRLMPKSSVQTEMGMISNLITDMTIKGANDDEIARAVKHSMVVIDAEKHKLDYKRSEQDNNISQLRKTYQGKASGGADTLISKASSTTYIPERRLARASEGGPIDKVTGELRYSPTGALRKEKGPDGKWTPTDKPKTTKTTKMAVVKDANELSSGSPMEAVYAEYANSMKELANRARLEYTKTPKHQYSPEAKKKYQAEVDSLDAQLKVAKANAPKERQAQRVANTIVKQKLEDNPHIDKEDVKKLKGQALVTARERTGAGKIRIKPTEKEWEAIQAGAISDNKLQEILKHGDSKTILALATPKQAKTLSTSQIGMIGALSNAGYTQAEIAQRLGVSASTVNNYL